MLVWLLGETACKQHQLYIVSTAQAMCTKILSDSWWKKENVFLLWLKAISCMPAESCHQCNTHMHVHLCYSVGLSGMHDWTRWVTITTNSKLCYATIMTQLLFAWHQLLACGPCVRLPGLWMGDRCGSLGWWQRDVTVLSFIDEYARPPTLLGGVVGDKSHT